MSDDAAADRPEAGDLHDPAPQKSPGPLSVLLWWAAGVNPRLVMHQSCWLERDRNAAMGMAVFATACLATLSSFAVLYNFVTRGMIAPSLIGAVAWGGIILTLDRLMLLTLWKGKQKSQVGLWVIAPRVLLALLVSVALSIPAELVVFDRQLDLQVRVDQEASIVAHSRQLAIKYSRLDDLNGQVQALSAEMRQADAATEEAYQAASCEADGSCGSGNEGVGPLYADKREHFAEVRTQAAAVRAANGPKIRELQQEASSLEGKRMRETQAFDATAKDSDDLLARLIALRHLENDAQHGATVTATAWVIRLLSLCLELLPLVLKLTARRGPYDAAFEAVQDGEAAQWEAVREKALSRSQVMIDQEYLIAAGVTQASREIIADAADLATRSPASRKAARSLSPSDHCQIGPGRAVGSGQRLRRPETSRRHRLGGQGCPQERRPSGRRSRGRAPPHSPTWMTPIRATDQLHETETAFH